MSVRRRPSTPELFDDCDSNGNPAAEVNIDFDDCGSDDENRWVQSPKAALKELYPDLSDDAISLILRNSDQNQNVDKSFSEHNEKNELHEVADQDDSDGGSANGVSKSVFVFDVIFFITR